MNVVNDKGMAMPPFSVQVRMIERQINMGMLEHLRIFLWPDVHGDQHADTGQHRKDTEGHSWPKLRH